VIKNPYISVGVSVASTVLVNDSTAEIEKNLKNEYLKTDEQKEKEACKVKPQASIHDKIQIKDNVPKYT